MLALAITPDAAGAPGTVARGAHRRALDVRLLVALALAVGLLCPRGAAAQESAFVATVQALVANPSQTGSVRDRMRGALAEWDRRLGSLESQAADGLTRDMAIERHLSLGLEYRRRGRLNDALRHFNSAAALNPTASDVHVLRALTFEAAGQVADADRAFHTAWTRDVENPIKAYLLLTRTRSIVASDQKQARSALANALDRVLAGTYQPARPPFVVLDLLPDATSQRPLVGNGQAGLAFAHLAEGRLDETLAALSEEGGSPRSPLAALAAGQRAEADGRLEDAQRDYSVALGGALAGRSAIYVAIARLHQVRGEAGEATEALGRAARLNPNAAVVHRELGAALVAAGRMDDAFAELVAALLVAPEDAEALAALGQLFLDTDRATDAIPVLRRALAVRAQRYQTRYALAVALSRAGQTDEAATEFARFERLSREALDGRRATVAGQPGIPEGPR